MKTYQNRCVERTSEEEMPFSQEAVVDVCVPGPHRFPTFLLDGGVLVVSLNT